MQGLPSSSQGVDLKNWRPDERVNLGYMMQLCPARPGFVRVGDIEVGIDSAIRRGSRVNVEVVFSDGKDGTFAVDCHSMTLGFNREPNKPVKPRSIGYEIYKLACK